MKKFAVLILAVIPFAGASAAPLFQVELLPGVNKQTRSCMVYFMPRPPAKKVIDAAMEQALSICHTVDPSHDLYVSAGTGSDGNDAVHQSTYAYLAYASRTGKITRILQGHQWDDVKP